MCCLLRIYIISYLASRIPCFTCCWTNPLPQQVVIIQACFNAILGLLVYKILIEPRKKVKEKINTDTTHTMQFLFAYGFGIPMVVMEPLYLIAFLGIRNSGLRMVILGTPIVNSLRITEGEWIGTSISTWIMDEMYWLSIESYFYSIARIHPSRSQKEFVQLHHLLFLHLQYHIRSNHYESETHITCVLIKAIENHRSGLHHSIFHYFHPEWVWLWILRYYLTPWFFGALSDWPILVAACGEQFLRGR